jgi:hypothetical protein
MSRDFHSDDDVVRALREALHAEARDVMPTGDGLARIREKTHSRRRLRWLHGAEMLGAAAAVGLVVAVVTGALNFGFGPASSNRDNGQIHTLTTPNPTSSVTPAPKAGPMREVTVFYVGHADGHPYVYAELHERPKPTANAVIRDAVEAVLTERPHDPTYFSPWPKGTQILGISHHGNVVVIDLSKEAGNGPKGLGTYGAQQLLDSVRSSITNAPDTEVALKIDGKSVRALWGDLIARDRGYPDGPVITVDDGAFAPVQILSPAWGAKVDSTFTFGGTATVFEANVSWEIVDRTGTIAAEGHTLASNAQSGTWWVSQTLAPGTYTLKAFAISPKDGSPQFTTSKVFTVK